MSPNIQSQCWLTFILTDSLWTTISKDCSFFYEILKQNKVFKMRNCMYLALAFESYFFFIFLKLFHILATKLWYIWRLYGKYNQLLGYKYFFNKPCGTRIAKNLYSFSLTQNDAIRLSNIFALTISIMCWVQLLCLLK